MRKNVEGYIVVETVGTFIPFVLLVISILSLVNIVTLQARVHNALTQAANSLSMYCYILNVTGVASDLAAIDNKSIAAGETIGAVLSGIEALSGRGGSAANAGDRVLTAAQQAAGDPKAMAQSFANYGVNELRNQASAGLVLPMVERYLASREMSAGEYLSSVRVVNFELGDCVLVDRNGNVKLTAEYEIGYTFGALRLPFGPTLKVTQTAVTKAWLNGSGEGYR